MQLGPGNRVAIGRAVAYYYIRGAHASRTGIKFRYLTTFIFAATWPCHSFMSGFVLYHKMISKLYQM